MPGKQNPRRQSTVALAAGIPVSKPTPKKRRRKRQMRYPQGGQGRNVREVLPTKSPYKLEWTSG
jgi:hypothetical protein